MMGEPTGMIPTTGSINHPPSIHLEVAQTASSVEQVATIESNDHKKYDIGFDYKKKKVAKNNEGAKQTKNKKQA